MLRYLLRLLVLAAAAAPLAVLAQSYPTKPIRLLVPFTPGGSQDVIGRLLAQKVSDALGQPIVIENKAGAGGLIATQEEARAAPDGYTLLLSTGAQMAIEPALNPKAGYDPLKDFAHVVHLGDAPLVLLAVPTLPVASVKELIALSKAKPHTINTASTGNGTYTHLTIELFKSASGADLTHVPYKGAAPAFNDLMGGQVQTMFTTTASAQPYTSSGRLKALAVTAAKRSAMMPDVPTFAEAGTPLDVSVWIGIAAPAGTPPAVVERLNAEFNKALAAPDVKAKLAALGVDPVGGTSAQMTQYVKGDVERWAKIIKAANIKIE
ncbi:MAG TPA: tripartite tricarboxylate transporter substrate binding protein [Casimicrobiaceae bacterium]|nr:tripartite tricarboxylate transporter substrate binding protein [Casimicrobiaceae bacterium]